MFEELYETLGVKEGDRMYLAPQERINIWGQNA
jgi:predicted metalloendopeptidase